MSTILQPCFESQFIETATVKLKFAPSSSVEFGRTTDELFHHQQLATDVGGNSSAKSSADLCGLGFQQILANICSSSKETIEKETVYVHPLSKRSSFSRLSEKSFEMCTENLGSETGTDIMDNSILSLSSSSISSPREKSLSPSSSPREYSRNKVNSRNFPPPLTTISGANSVQVRPHREDGRLVIKAIETPAKHTYLRAERSNGRLRLCLLKDHAGDFYSQENYNEIDSDKDDIDVLEDDESYIDDEDLEETNQELNQDHQNEDDEDDESHAQIISKGDTYANNNFDIDVEMGMEKFQWLSRCNEGGHSNTVLHKPLFAIS